MAALKVEMMVGKMVDLKVAKMAVLKVALRVE